MGDFLNNVKDFMRGSRSAFATVSELFPPADIVNLRREIGIEEKAESNGKNDLPSRDAMT